MTKIKEEVYKILKNPKNKQSIINGAENGFELEESDLTAGSVNYDSDPKDYIKVVFNDGTPSFYIHTNIKINKKSYTNFRRNSEINFNR